MGLFQEEDPHYHAEDYHCGAYEVRQKVRVLVEEGVAFKVAWVIANRICKRASKPGAYYRASEVSEESSLHTLESHSPKAPDKRHDRICPCYNVTSVIIRARD